ncbi:MAG: hypothetical protein KAH38_02725 [Candidatus Hydrogenedentes bacterium]|nr:hypothetical protein [Candidatus Hydrogenedentota bacterium]
MKEDLYPHIEMLATQQPALILVGLIACGMLCCFFGYRTTRFLIDLSGFICFGLIVMLLAGVATAGNLLFMGIGLIAGGLIGTLLTRWVYRLGIMALGGGACSLLLWHFSYLLPAENWILPSAIGAGILGGILALFLQHSIISLVTAALGGLFVVHSVFLLLLRFEIEASLPESLGAFSGAALFTLAWIAVASAGFIFQMFLDRGQKEEKKQ